MVPAPSPHGDRFVYSREKPKPAAGPVTVKVRAPAPGQGSQGDARQAEWERFRSELRQQLDWYDEVAPPTGRRVQLLEFVLDLVRRPAAQREAALAGLRQDHAQLARAISEAAARSPGLVQRMQMFVTRFNDAARAAREAVELLDRTSEMTVGAALIAVQDFSIAKLKGRFYMITTPDLLFREDPVLRQVFPPIERTSSDAAKPSKPAPRPFKVPEPVPQRQATPAPSGLPETFTGLLRKLREGLESR